MIFGWPQEKLHVGGSHPERLSLFLHDLPRHLAAQRRHVALEAPNTRLARITANNFFDPILRKRDETACQSVILLLLGNQELLGDLDFFFLRIAGDRDHLHTIEERTRNIMHCVGCHHPEHMGQIKGQFDIVIAERVILLGVENLEQGGAWIASEIRAHLVDFIQQENRVLRPDGLHPLDNPSGQRPHISTPVSPNLRFIAHATERYADKLALHGTSDRAGQGSLANTRRPNKAQNRPLHRFRQLADGQIFQNAFFDFFQPIMVFFQILLGNVDVQPIRSFVAPGKPEQPVKVGADHTAFRRHRRHLFQSFDLLGDFLRNLFRQFLVLHLLPVFLDFGSSLIFLTQLLLDRLHLLAQKVFFLRFFHLFAHTAADFLFYFENFHFPVDDFHEKVQAGTDVDSRQQFLLVLQFQRQMAQDQITEPVGVIYSHHRGNSFRRDFLAQFRPLFELMRQHTGLCFKLRGFAHHDILELLHLDLKKRIFLHIPDDPGPVEAFHQNAHSAAGELQKLFNLGHRPCLIDICGRRCVVLRIPLRGKHDQTVLHHDLLQRIDRLFPTNVQMDDHVRKYQYAT